VAGSLTRRSSCPACRSGRAEEIYSAPYSHPPISSYLEAFYSGQGLFEPELVRDAEYVLLACGDCGLIYQRDIPDAEFAARLYEIWIEPGAARQRAEERGLAAALALACEITGLIVEHGGEGERLKTLDYGMGWGNWCLMARALGCESFGSDISPTRIEYATRCGIEVVSPDRVPAASFDLINADQVFEHLVDPLDTLTRLRDALLPGGLIMLRVPDGGGMRERFWPPDWSAPFYGPDSLNPVSPLEHINCFDHNSLVRLARQAGLSPTRLSLKARLACVPNPGPSFRADMRRFASTIYRHIRPYRGTSLVLKAGE
jgi:SAM-dependent methyltransferase